MCGCNPCECWWCNCGRSNGRSIMVLCCGCWCCKSPLMQEYGGIDCCFCFEGSGCGCNLSCLGSICCTPEWLDRYSYMVSTEGRMDRYR